MIIPFSQTVNGQKSKRDAEKIVALEMLRRLGLKVDARPIEELVPAIFMLSREHELSSYDSAYLELAAREGATLCSHDGELRAAAKRIGLSLLPAA